MQTHEIYIILIGISLHRTGIDTSSSIFDIGDTSNYTNDHTRSRGKEQEAADLLDYRSSSSIQVTCLDMYYKGIFITPKAQLLDLGPGIVHLYKGIPDAETLRNLDKTNVQAPGEEDVLAVLAVPSYLSSSDFLGFIGDATKSISHLRMIGTADPSRYMVLIKFRSAAYASEFKQNFNGALFNTMEPETVHCVPIALVSFRDRLSFASEFPELASQVQGKEVTSHKISAKPKPPFTACLTELPTCVVCLERMDSTITGLLTILCEHTFHCSCISKWVNTHPQCPICRHSMAKDMIENSEKWCAACMSTKNLWMCLICGNVACGRYESQHA